MSFVVANTFCSNLNFFIKNFFLENLKYNQCQPSISMSQKMSSLKFPIRIPAIKTTKTVNLALWMRMAMFAGIAKYAECWPRPAILAPLHAVPVEHFSGTFKYKISFLNRK
jgi:hypothetical protein